MKNAGYEWFVSYPVNNLTSGNKYFFHRICEHDHDYSSRKCDLCRKISINRPVLFYTCPDYGQILVLL
ncbi:hypothetical protein DMC46_11820 [Escherichia coli]|nr:hypothetical protein [Escherichia coli]EFO2787891.1 hypothetical protein [Escherichia coli]EGE1765672.1 hypothetical protein [Escherichia coli]MDN1906478.1 hypothetical protein [Escherichia coli]